MQPTVCQLLPCLLHQTSVPKDVWLALPERHAIVCRKLIVQLHTDKQAGMQTPDSAATMVNAAKQHLVK